MIYLVYAVNFLLMILAPLLLARFIAARRKIGWGLFGVGGATFILSQIGHIPFNWLVLQRFEWIQTEDLVALAVFAGLSAAVFEESGRYLAYRFSVKDAHTWGRGLMLGAGHGGVESILVGLLGGWGIVQLALFREGIWIDRIPTEHLPLVQAQIEAAFSAPWRLILLGAAERIMALSIHLSLSLLVMQLFVRGERRWLLLTILWHALIDALVVYAVSTWGVYVTEAIVAGTAVISIGVTFWLKAPEPVEPVPESLPQAGPARPIEMEITAEALEKSRFE